MRSISWCILATMIVAAAVVVVEVAVVVRSKRLEKVRNDHSR
jgi:hypothetical protein